MEKPQISISQTSWSPMEGFMSTAESEMPDSKIAGQPATVQEETLQIQLWKFVQRWLKTWIGAPVFFGLLSFQMESRAIRISG